MQKVNREKQKKDVKIVIHNALILQMLANVSGLLVG
jgi:hypothetical protein